jgi:hypothetical protein
MKLIVREADIPRLSPLTFAIELPDELGEKFSLEFLRAHFSKFIMVAYTDLYIVDSEECIDRINASLWHVKRDLLNFYINSEEKREQA